jgi:hypothetical protein
MYQKGGCEFEKYKKQISKNRFTSGHSYSYRGAKNGTYQNNAYGV